MSHPRAVLRQPESYPESRLPPGVQPLQRPPALGRAVELAFLRWGKRRLAPTEEFWRGFGMHIVSKSPERVVARAAGPAPCIAIAVQGPHDRFVGPAFRMSDDTDLDRYIKELGARELVPESIPGAGRGIELSDPSGRSVWLLQKQDQMEPLPVREAVVAATNTAQHRPRVNRMVRTPIEPARIVRLGHVVLQTVDFPRMADWYLTVLGLIPTDVQYLADGSPNLAFCRLNLGEQPADHHTVVLVGGIDRQRCDHLSELHAPVGRAIGRVADESARHDVSSDGWNQPQGRAGGSSASLSSFSRSGVIALRRKRPSTCTRLRRFFFGFIDAGASSPQAQIPPNSSGEYAVSKSEVNTSPSV